MFINSIVYDYNNILKLFDILKKDIYDKRAVLRFKDINVKNNYITFTCPYHKNGNENKPSAHLLLEDKGELPKGFIKCFSCGKTSTLPEMISELLYNKYDNGESGVEYINNIFGILEEGVTTGIRRELLEEIEKRSSKNQNTEFQYFEHLKDRKLRKEKTDDEIFNLDEYRYIHPYMYERGLTDEIIEKFDIGYQSNYSDGRTEYECITFPVKNEFGRVVTVMRRAIYMKRFFIEKNIKKPIYGIDKITNKNKELFIVESIFNCLTLWKWGYEAIALIGLGTSEQFAKINKLFYNKIKVICMDGDEAGRNAAKRISKNLNGIGYIIDMYDNKDINNITMEEFNYIYNLYGAKNGR